MLLLLAGGCGAGEAPADGPLAGRNVVVIVIDTLRADRLSFYGCERENAEFLAGLAQRSVVFEQSYAASSWTAPSTASLFTSLHPDHHGVITGLQHYELIKDKDEERRLNRIPSEVETLPEFFRNLGYRTYGIADNPNITERLGFARGFERFANFGYEGAERVNAQLAEWENELLSSEQPWFLYLHYMDPHLPYHERAPWYSLEGRPDIGKFTEKLAAYDSEIAYVDQHIAEVFARLRLEGDALVVVTADHGEEFGDHGGRGHPVKVYNELIRVPLLVHNPLTGSSPGRVSAPAGPIDLLPTLRELFGAPAQRLDEGVSLASAVLDPAGHRLDAKRTMFSLRTREGDRDPLQRNAIVSGRHKAIFTLPKPEAELYDLDYDPREQRDIASKRPGLLAELQQELAEFEARPLHYERQFSEAASQTDDEIDMLKRLGYAGDE